MAARLPQTVYVYDRRRLEGSIIRGDAKSVEELIVARDPKSLVETLDDDLRCGVYELVGRIDVQNRTIAREAKPAKKGGNR